MKEKEARRAAKEAKRRKEEEEETEDEEEKESPTNEIDESPKSERFITLLKKNYFVIFIELIFRKRSLSPVETKKKKKKQRSLTEFINEDTTKTINDTEQLALYLLSK